MHTWEISLPIDVFAVHDQRFIRMQFESTLAEALANLCQDKLGLGQTSAVDNPVIRIAAKSHAGKMTADPAVESIVQRRVSQQRTNDAALREAEAREAYKGKLFLANDLERYVLDKEGSLAKAM